MAGKAAITGMQRRRRPLSCALGFSVAGAALLSVCAPAAGAEGLFTDLQSKFSLSNGVSADGSTVVGAANGAPVAWNSGRGAFSLGGLDPGAPSGAAYAANADGSVIVGASTDRQGRSQAFRWTSAGGMSGLGILAPDAGASSRALAVTPDGTTVVGVSNSADGSAQAFRWTAGTGVVGLGVLNSSVRQPYSSARFVSADGKVVAGNSTARDLFYGLPGNVPFRWTEASGMIQIGRSSYWDSSYLVGMSADGSVLAVNQGGFPVGMSSSAYRWTVAGDAEDLGALPTTSTIYTKTDAAALSADGSTIVGACTIDNYREEAFRWTHQTGIVGLGFLNQANSKESSESSLAQAVSANGGVVAGISGSSSYTVFRWTEATGMKDLAALLQSAGVTIGPSFPLNNFLRYYTQLSVSADGQFISATGAQTWIARYVDGTGGVGGLTDPDSVRRSVDALAARRGEVAAQMHGFAAPLLGDNAPIESGGEAGIYGSIGSTAGGGQFRQRWQNLTVFGGIGEASEGYAGADMQQAILFAGAARWAQPLASNVSGLVEIGGWWSPSGEYRFTRSYVNGAGFATGSGGAEGSQAYVFGRIGPVFAVTASDEVAVTAELGAQRLAVGGYDETFGAANPFNATVGAGVDRMGVGKARAQWTHRFNPAWDSTLWLAGTSGFDYRSNMTAFVAGVGRLTPALRAPRWGEYGLRVGFRPNDQWTLEGYVNGIAAGDGGSRAHFGAAAKVSF